MPESVFLHPEKIHCLNETPAESCLSWYLSQMSFVRCLERSDELTKGRSCTTGMVVIPGGDGGVHKHTTQVYIKVGIQVVIQDAGACRCYGWEQIQPNSHILTPRLARDVLTPWLNLAGIAAGADRIPGFPHVPKE